jgi:serine/threonine-protein kinase
MAIQAWIETRCGAALCGLLLFALSAKAQGPPPAGHGPYFPADSPWYQDISAAPLDAESSLVINWLNSVGWGGGQMQIDFSIEVLQADAGTPLRSFTPTVDFFNPDCDNVPIPVPAGGALEGESGYQCVSDGDCHLLVVYPPTHKLYEMWRANITGPATSQFQGGCLAVWDMSLTYPPVARGQGCTSADGAGFPMAPLLFSADEVAAGHIDHAIRFILPNSRIRQHVYVHPATHTTNPTSGPAAAPPYGTRLRLRADYPLASLPNDGARVVARAMQKYGILLADGGTIALTAQNDTFTTAKWSGLLGSHDLAALHVSDFQMVAAGDRYGIAVDCVRTTPLFYDGLEVGDLAKWSGAVP